MDNDWCKGYLKAVSGDGGKWETLSFVAVQPEPYHVHRITGMKFYLVLEEARRSYRKDPFHHRIYSVGVAYDDSQSGECSHYTSLLTGKDFPPILDRFNQYQEFAISRSKKEYSKCY